MEGPIPPPLPDDEEDVSWALSTASALWGRGERAEALKWLRRAAEHASDLNADARALHLFKAAADLSGRLSAPPPATSTAPAAPPQPAKVATSFTPSPPVVAIHRVESAMANATLPSAMAKQLGARLDPALEPSRRPPPPKPPLSPRSLQPATPAPPGAVRVTHARTIQSADAEGLEATIRREPAVEVPVVARHAVPMGRPDSRGFAERSVPPARPSEPRRVPEPRRSEPRAEPTALGRRPGHDESGRKKTVDERLLKEATVQASSRVRVSPRNEHFNVDDEVTQTRSAASLANLVGASARFDDLDEDTRVLTGRSDDSVMTPSIESELDHAIDALADEASNAVEITATEMPEEEASKTEVGFAWSPSSSDGPRAVPAQPPAPRDARGRGEGRNAAVMSVAVPSTERMAPIPVLNAVRVAVLPGNTPGEARLIVLDGVGTPPAGAVHAVLLPLTSADGLSILRLLGG